VTTFSCIYTYIALHRCVGCCLMIVGLSWFHFYNQVPFFLLLGFLTCRTYLSESAFIHLSCMMHMGSGMSVGGNETGFCPAKELVRKNLASPLYALAHLFYIFFWGKIWNGVQI